MSCNTKKCYFMFLYDDLEEYEDEIAKLDRIIAAEPENFYAWHNRGVMHWEIGNGAAARRDLTQAASLPHTDYMPHNSLTVVFKEAGETDAAIAACTTGLAILPNDPVLNRQLGLLYAEKKLYELALKHIDIAIHNNDSYIYLASHRTAILKALNKPRQT